MKKRTVIPLVVLAVLGIVILAGAQSLEVQRNRLQFALHEFTGATHMTILQDATAVEYLYPRTVGTVIAEQGRREAQYLRSLPSWSPLKESWSGWQTFADTYDPPEAP